MHFVMMNIPSVYRKAVDGFVIPPRTFLQMFLSAARGAVSLFNEKNRSDFIDKLDKGIINEGVISQATAAPLMMLSLFHDLQNPLWKRYQFDPSDFLEGIGPALQNFHNVSGELENELYKILQKEETSSSNKNQSEYEIKDADDAKDGESSASSSSSLSSSEQQANDSNTVDGGTKNHHHDVLAAFGSFQGIPFPAFEIAGTESKMRTLLNHDWMEDAKKHPDSLAGQLSRMLSSELFQIHQISAKTAFLFQHHHHSSRKIKFKQGSCTVNNVALLSARAFGCKENELYQSNEVTSKNDNVPRYEIIDYGIDEADMETKSAGVAAQMEILYDVTQHFTVNDGNSSSTVGDKENEESEKSEKQESMQTTIVSVATLEGWLKGGPDGELRWRLSLYRPAFEFPGIQQSY